MVDDLKSRNAISRPPIRTEDISRRILTYRGTAETKVLKSQIVTSSGWGGRRRSLPLAFTEQGVAMLSGVLNSPRAVQANIFIMRAFVQLRRMLVSHEELARKVDALERNYDAQFRAVFDAILALMEPPSPPRRRIGF